MRIRDYQVDDTEQVTSELLNNVTGDFSDAMTKAYLELRKLKERNEIFRDASGLSMNYLIQRINAASTSLAGLKVTAYDNPVSSSNIQLDHTYGQVSLAETNRITHIPLVEDNYDRLLAAPSVAVQTGRTESTFDTNEDARVTVDGEGEIWKETIAPADTDSGSLWIKVTTPNVGKTPSFVSIYPLAGTTVEEIKIIRQNGNTSFTPGSTWPVKIHQNFSDYSNEVRFKIRGILGIDGNYVFVIRKIDIYSVAYASQGIITYRTRDAFTSILSYTKNDPYFYPSAAQSQRMIKIRILSEDGLTILHDSSQSSDIDPVPAGPDYVQVEITLYRSDGNTPFVKTVT